MAGLWLRWVFNDQAIFGRCLRLQKDYLLCPKKKSPIVDGSYIQGRPFEVIVVVTTAQEGTLCKSVTVATMSNYDRELSEPRVRYHLRG